MTVVVRVPDGAGDDGQRRSGSLAAPRHGGLVRQRGATGGTTEPVDRILDGIGVLRLRPTEHDATVSDLMSQALQVEYEAFARAGYVGSGRTAGSLDDEYTSYRSASRFYVRQEDNGRVVAVLRVIADSPCGLKTLNDLEIDPVRQAEIEALRPDRIREVGTAATTHGAQPGADFAKVYAAAIIDAQAEGATHSIASIDNRALRYFRSRLAMLWEDIGPSNEDYMGSPTTPVILDFARQSRHYQRTRPDLYRSIFKGEFQ